MILCAHHDENNENRFFYFFIFIFFMPRLPAAAKMKSFLLVSVLLFCFIAPLLGSTHHRPRIEILDDIDYPVEGK